MSKATSKSARYERRNRTVRDLVKVCVWVPVTSRDTVLQLAEKLRHNRTKRR